MRRLTSIYIGALLSGISCLVSAQQAEPVTLPVPVQAPLSWQTCSNKALARPAAPGGLRVVAPSTSPDRSFLVGAWQKEKPTAGELSSFVLNSAGSLTATFAEPKTNLTAKGKWEIKEETIQLKFASQTEKASIPVLRDARLSIVREEAGIVLVGEQNTRFVRPKL